MNYSFASSERSLKPNIKGKFGGGSLGGNEILVIIHTPIVHKTNSYMLRVGIANPLNIFIFQLCILIRI
jgi:hypothetical protein